MALSLAACHHAGSGGVDRFSTGHALKGRLAAGAPIDMDVAPFVTQGLGPDGVPVKYYNFDVQPREPAVMHRQGGKDTVDVLPGMAGYNDFWVIEENGQRTPTAIDCPIVPAGTKHALGGEEHQVWYAGKPYTCLLFGAPLVLEKGLVPTSPIYVTFKSEGVFATDGTTQTHNVVFSVPGDTDYSPLWAVHVYPPEDFAKVHDMHSAEAEQTKDGPLVNCPIVSK